MDNDLRGMALVIEHALRYELPRGVDEWVIEMVLRECRRMMQQRVNCSHEYWLADAMGGRTYCRWCGVDTTEMEAMGG